MKSGTCNKSCVFTTCGTRKDCNALEGQVDQSGACTEGVATGLHPEATQGVKAETLIMVMVVRNSSSRKCSNRHINNQNMNKHCNSHPRLYSPELLLPR